MSFLLRIAAILTAAAVFAAYAASAVFSNLPF